MEPERPIEKLLRAWGKKRRDEAGAPFEMHPATRRLLQGEVARQFGKQPKQPRSFSQILVAWWPRAAWGLAVVALAGVLAAILLPSLRNGNRPGTFADSERGMLARNEEAITAPPASAPAPVTTTANASADEVRLAYDKSAVMDQKQLAPALKDGRAETEKNGALTLDQPVAGEQNSALKVADADSVKDSEGKRRDVSGALREPATALESAAPAPGFGLAGNPASVQNQPTAPVLPPTALGGALADRTSAGRKLSLDTVSQPAPTPSVSAGARPALTDEFSRRVKAETTPVELAAKSLPQPSAAVPPAGAKESDSLVARLADDAKKSDQLGIVQQFTRLDVLSKSKTSNARQISPAPAVLVSFQLEQNGRDLRVVDGDGSVYTGSVQWADAVVEPATEAVNEAVTRARRARQAKPEAQKPAPALQPAPQKYFFRVAGTNRSLNENVVFSGDLLTTNAAFFMQITNHLATTGREGKEQPPGATQFPALLLRNSSISGKASVGDRGEVQINAVPTAK